MTRTSPFGDMDPEEFRRDGAPVADWIADYLAHSIAIRCLRKSLPAQSHPHSHLKHRQEGESFDRILADFERSSCPASRTGIIPAFSRISRSPAALPASSRSFCRAALNVQAMLWRTSPAATEFEEVTLAWLRKLLGLPSLRRGHLRHRVDLDLHALAAARERAVPSVRSLGLAGRDDVPACASIAPTRRTPRSTRP